MKKCRRLKGVTLATKAARQKKPGHDAGLFCFSWQSKLGCCNLVEEALNFFGQMIGLGTKIARRSDNHFS